MAHRSRGWHATAPISGPGRNLAEAAEPVEAWSILVRVSWTGWAMSVVNGTGLPLNAEQTSRMKPPVFADLTATPDPVRPATTWGC